MSDLEQDIKELKLSLQRIEKRLGIGTLNPGNVVNINRKAMRDAAEIMERKNVSPTKGK